MTTKLDEYQALFIIKERFLALYHYLAFFLWKYLISSTKGIIETAKAREIAYSSIPIGVKPNALAKKGISITHVVRIKDASILRVNILL